jgi:hypothetical protein
VTSIVRHRARGVFLGYDGPSRFTPYLRAGWRLDGCRRRPAGSIRGWHLRQMTVDALDALRRSSPSPRPARLERVDPLVAPRRHRLTLGSRGSAPSSPVAPADGDPCPASVPDPAQSQLGRVLEPLSTRRPALFLLHESEAAQRLLQHASDAQTLTRPVTPLKLPEPSGPASRAPVPAVLVV